jgi:glycosyltransferase involved in cell wall biosynthesis
MTRAAGSLLQGVYGIPRSRVSVIPHGVPDLPSAPTDTIRSSLGIAGRDIILGFGMLRPDRGCELVIDALPALLKRHPTATYVIVGATDPAVLDRDGEAYRESLQARVEELDLGNHVRFVDRFVQRMELIRWLPRPGPVRIGHAGLRDGVRPRDRFDTVRRRSRTAGRRPRRPGGR